MLANGEPPWSPRRLSRPFSAPVPSCGYRGEIDGIRRFPFPMAHRALVQLEGNRPARAPVSKTVFPETRGNASVRLVDSPVALFRASRLRPRIRRVFGAPAIFRRAAPVSVAARRSSGGGKLGVVAELIYDWPSDQWRGRMGFARNFGDGGIVPLPPVRRAPDHPALIPNLQGAST